MFNQSIHNLPRCDNFKLLHDSLTKAHRVLKNCGICIINTSTKDQHKHGFWWSSLIPGEIGKICSRLPVRSRLDQEFCECARRIGFVDDHTETEP